MQVMLTTPLLASVIHGTAVPILWVIGIILIVVGAVAIFRRSLLLGVVLVVIGIVLGGLNVF
jgi:drug/metabolite transporter (DMT)-like permease